MTTNLFRMTHFRKNASVTPLVSHTFKTKDLKPFRITHFQKKVGVPHDNDHNLKVEQAFMPVHFRSKTAPHCPAHIPLAWDRIPGHAFRGPSAARRAAAESLHGRRHLDNPPSAWLA